MTWSPYWICVFLLLSVHVLAISFMFTTLVRIGRQPVEDNRQCPGGQRSSCHRRKKSSDRGSRRRSSTSSTTSQNMDASQQTDITPSSTSDSFSDARSPSCSP